MILRVFSPVFLAVLLVLCLHPPASAQLERMHVIGSPVCAAQIVTVATSDGDFTSVQAAVDSITDASAEKPYVVVIGPGHFYGKVRMKEYVNLVGSGEASTILNDVSDTTIPSGPYPALITANNTEIRSLTVATGVWISPTVVWNIDTSPRFIQVTLLQTWDDAPTVVVNKSSDAMNPTKPFFQDVTIQVAANYNSTGMYNENSSPTLVNVSITAIGGIIDNYAMISAGTSQPVAYDCRFKSDEVAVHVTGGNTTLVNSMLDGGRSGTLFTCVQCYDGNFTLLGAQCQ